MNSFVTLPPINYKFQFVLSTVSISEKKLCIIAKSSVTFLIFYFSKSNGSKFIKLLHCGRHRLYLYLKIYIYTYIQSDPSSFGHTHYFRAIRTQLIANVALPFKKMAVPLFTTLLLGCSPSGTLFQDIFSISVALSLGVVLQLSNITPGGSEARVEGRSTRWNRDNIKTLKTILSAVFSLDHKNFLSVKIHK